MAGVNFQPLVLACDCGYRTPEVGRNGQPLSEAKAKDVFNRHSCAKRTDPQYYRLEVPCKECGKPRLIRRDTVHQNRVCRACWTQHWRTLLTARHQELDEMAVERILMRSPVVSTRAERQAAVEYLARRGLSGREIARRTGMSQRTVERLRARAAA